MTELFSGGLTRLDDQGQATGIYKKAITGPVRLGFQGLDGDVQADRRVHGGPEKALHQYAVDSYRRLGERFGHRRVGPALQTRPRPVDQPFGLRPRHQHARPHGQW